MLWARLLAVCGLVLLGHGARAARAQGGPAGSVYQRGTDADATGQGERIVAASRARGHGVRGLFQLVADSDLFRGK